QTRQQILDRILTLPEGMKFLVLAPLIRAQKGEYRDLFADLQKQGFVRARVGSDMDNLFLSIQPPESQRGLNHSAGFRGLPP
ncbi:MAG: hypothetical protein ACWGMZ_06700, partial [Thermoguttaceae bacterium]